MEEARKKLPIYSARGSLIRDCREHYSLIILGENWEW